MSVKIHMNKGDGKSICGWKSKRVTPNRKLVTCLRCIEINVLNKTKEINPIPKMKRKGVGLWGSKGTKAGIREAEKRARNRV